MKTSSWILGLTSVALVVAGVFALHHTVKGLATAQKQNELLLRLENESIEEIAKDRSVATFFNFDSASAKRLRQIMSLLEAEEFSRLEDKLNEPSFKNRREIETLREKIEALIGAEAKLAEEEDKLDKVMEETSKLVSRYNSLRQSCSEMLELPLQPALSTVIGEVDLGALTFYESGLLLHLPTIATVPDNIASAESLFTFTTGSASSSNKRPAAYLTKIRELIPELTSQGATLAKAVAQLKDREYQAQQSVEHAEQTLTPLRDTLLAECRQVLVQSASEDVGDWTYSIYRRVRGTLNRLGLDAPDLFNPIS